MNAAAAVSDASIRQSLSTIRDKLFGLKRRSIEELCAREYLTLNDPLAAERVISKGLCTAEEYGELLANYRVELTRFVNDLRPPRAQPQSPANQGATNAAYTPSLEEASLADVIATFYQQVPTAPWIRLRDHPVPNEGLDLTRIFITYFAKEISAGLYGPRHYYRSGTPIAVPETAFRQRFGPPPWTVFETILGTCGLGDYSVTCPGEYGQFQARIRKDDLDLDFGQLSSGERILLALGALNFGSRPPDRTGLLLLDELDALLNPMLARNFIEVLKTISEKQNTHVCLTTHSPATVALWPNDHVILLRRRVPRVEVTTRQNALNFLCANLFSVITTGFRIVLVEDQDDVKLYSLVAQAAAAQALLNAGSVVFLPVGNLQEPVAFRGLTGGKQKVKRWLNDLKAAAEAGILRAICDKDGDGAIHSLMLVTKRYSIENYLCDPIFIFISSCLNLKNRPLNPVLLSSDLHLTDLQHVKGEALKEKLQHLVNDVTAAVAPKVAGKLNTGHEEVFLVTDSY